MKRIIKSTLIIIMTLVFLVGCTMKENIVFQISSNKKMTVKLIVAMDDEMIDAMIDMKNGDSSIMSGDKPKKAKEHTDEERWNYLNDGDSQLSDAPEGFKSEKYEKDGFKGYVYSKEVGTIDDVSKESATERYNLLSSDKEDAKKDDKKEDDSSSDVDMNSLLKETLFIKKGNKYTSNMTLKSEDSADMSSYEQYGASFDLKFVIELPNKPISNNATEVSKDGKTLSWDLLKGGDINVEFSLGGSNILLYVGIGIGALVVLFIILRAVKKAGKKEAEPFPENPMNSIQGGPIPENPIAEEPKSEESMVEETNAQTDEQPPESNNL